MSAASEQRHCLIRPLSERDVDRVMEIELQAYPHPWTRGIFLDCMKAGYEFWGLQLDTGLEGYCVMNHAVGESHLLNLCLAPRCQGRGLGGILLEHCFRVAIAAGCDSMFLEVRPSNVAAIGLYRRNGFRLVGRRPAYYTDGEGREDALIMRRDL